MTARLRAALRRVAGAHHRVRAEAERGTTMVEVVVAMTIMTICGAIFTSAVVTLNRTSNQAQAITNAATQNNQAYQALDKTVRYAAAISTPGTGSTGNWYVELSTTTSGAEVCTQLRVETPDTPLRRLQRRTWSVANPSGTLSGWVPLASGITNGDAAAGSTNPGPPFVLQNAGSAIRQQLRFTLVSRSGTASQPVSSTSSFSLTALNSSGSVPSGAVCQGVVRE